MVEKDRDDARATEASLELPSFGLRRRRRDAGGSTAAQAPAPETDADNETETGAAEAPAREESHAVTEPIVATAAEPTARIPSTPATPATPSTRRRRSAPALPPLPALSGAAASLVTGLVVGLVGVLLTLGSLAGCEAIRGTSSCGGPGVFLLLAILVVMFVLGRALLTAWEVRDPGSTSVLAVGLVAVLALTVLIEVILSWTMLIVVPLVAMGAFGVSHWATTKVAEADDDE